VDAPAPADAAAAREADRLTVAVRPDPLLTRVARRLLGRGGWREPSPFATYAAVDELARRGAAPLLPHDPAAAEAEALDVAVVIPWYPPGGGGHATIFNLVRQLEARGHRCSIWLDDPGGRHAGLDEATVARELRELFGGCAGPIRKGFAGWRGADVVVATGWPTAYRAQLLDRCRARAYLVQDHEPEFHPTSAESLWAAATYRAGLHCIAASTWLAGLLEERYGVAASSFDLGIDHDRYAPPAPAPSAAAGRADRVLFYARASTERRAVPLGLFALAELKRRRPQTQIALFGAAGPPQVPFPCEQLGLLTAQQLADAYRGAGAGLVLSLTNPSLVPQEMLACGLPCVDVDLPATRSEWGVSGGVELAAADPQALAGALARLLDDRELHARRSAAGVAWAAGRTWPRAAEQVEAGLRTALRGA